MNLGLKRRIPLFCTSWLIAGVAIAGLLWWANVLSSPAYGGPPMPLIASGSTPGPALRRLTEDGTSTPLSWTQDGQYLLASRPGRSLGDQQLSELWVLSVEDETAWMLSDNAFYPAEREGQVAFLGYAPESRWQLATLDLWGEQRTGLGEAQWSLPPAWIQGSVLYLAPSELKIVSSPTSPPARDSEIGLPAIRSDMRALLSPDGQAVAVTDGKLLWVSEGLGQIAIAQADQIWGFSWSGRQDLLAYVLSNGGPNPELWIWDRQGRRSWLLLRSQMEHWGTPAWSADGGRLAWARHPVGSAPNTTGDIWLATAAPSGEGLAPHALALTANDEHAPCWSPDGQTLAFALNGDIWLADLDTPGLADELAAIHPSDASARAAFPLSGTSLPEDAALAPLGLAVPLTIRVKHDPANTCRTVPAYHIDEYDLEAYVKRVVPHEVYVSWPDETLKAQAVAARTYAWRKLIDRRAANEDFDVWDSTRDQYMCDHTYTRTDAAVDATPGQHITYDAKIIYAFYCAETGTPTNYRQELNLVAAPYLRPIEDRVSLGMPRSGHSWGLSQWGSYRWAAWHGWNYQQILCHYYSGASVEPPGASMQPLASLIGPEVSTFVNTDQVYLQANGATGSAEAMTVTFGAKVAGVWIEIDDDTDPGDGWSTVWPVAAYADTLTPSLQLRITLSDSSGASGVSDMLALGLDRTPPTGTFLVSATEIATLTAPLYLTATDAPSATASVSASLGEDGWQWQDRALYTSGGEVVTDSLASDGSAWHSAKGVPGVLFGPYTTILTPGHTYRAWFRIRVPTAALTSPLEIARLDVTRRSGTELVGIHYLRGTDFQAGDRYQELAVDFDLDSSEALEFRVHAYGLSDLWVDQVAVGRYPLDLSTTTSWTLPTREGPTTLSARFVDRAGNVLQPPPLSITVTDQSPPGEWGQFTCAGFTCTVQVRDAIAGLNTHSAAYQTSADGGASWSDWLPANCTGPDGSHSVETLAAIALPMPVTQTVRWIQFRVDDLAAAANTGHSPVYMSWYHHLYLPAATNR